MAHDDRELQDALGLDHFEGGSWQGWHRHVTLVSVAHAFVTWSGWTPKRLRRPDRLPVSGVPAQPLTVDGVAAAVGDADVAQDC